MNLAISIVAALAVACVLAMLYLAVMDALYPPPRAPRAPSINQITGADCVPDGVAITSEDRLRVAVIYTDTVIWKRRGPDGRKATVLDIRAEADEFARRQASPDVTLAMLERCDSSLGGRYSQGYWMISSALTREAARRRGVEIAPLRAMRAPS